MYILRKKWLVMQEANNTFYNISHLKLQLQKKENQENYPKLGSKDYFKIVRLRKSPMRVALNNVGKC